VRATLGEDIAFSFEWISLYRFQSRRLQRFREGRVLFAGDAAHQMSPFGARGGNSGIQDADNLAWKLDLVLRGLAPDALIDSYDSERVLAAEENLRITSRTADFLSPKSAASRALRDAVLALAETEPFARALVNSGRLSTATCYDGSPLNGPDGLEAGAAPAVRPGAAALDAPLDRGWLLDRLGAGFACVSFGGDAATPRDLQPDARPAGNGTLPVALAHVSHDVACARYGAARAPALYLFRPDGHVAARWRTAAPGDLRAAVARATAGAAV
jgi:3-(3-hydroxy-phenyl)propionate hydroxylase